MTEAEVEAICRRVYREERAREDAEKIAIMCEAVSSSGCPPRQPSTEAATPPIS